MVMRRLLETLARQMLKGRGMGRVVEQPIETPGASKPQHGSGPRQTTTPSGS